MKSKKLLLPIIVLVSAIFLIAAYSVVSNIATKPKITEAEFPFTITYELDGEIITIDEVYRAYYVENGGYADTKSRFYAGEIGNCGEDNITFTLRSSDTDTSRIELTTYLYADYLMGDPLYDYFDEEGEKFEPIIYYYDAQENEYHDEATLAAQGVKLISYEYPTPIKNSFTFSHISYCSSMVVLPILLIAFIALIVMLIFAKKEKDLKYKALGIISIVLNYLIGFTLLPFITLVALLFDINGGGPELFRQIFYFIPAFFVLCITASVGLRRKGFRVGALITQLIGPAVFGIYLLVCAAFSLL